MPVLPFCHIPHTPTPTLRLCVHSPAHPPCAPRAHPPVANRLPTIMKQPLTSGRGSLYFDPQQRSEWRIGVRNRAQIQPWLAVRRVSNPYRSFLEYACRALRPVSRPCCTPAAIWGPDPTVTASARRVDAYHGSAKIPSSASMIGSTPVAVQSLTTTPLTHMMERRGLFPQYA